MAMAKDPDQYSDKEAKVHFEAALKSAMNTPHKPLKEKPKVKGGEESESEKDVMDISRALDPPMVASTQSQILVLPGAFGEFLDSRRDSVHLRKRAAREAILQPLDRPARSRTGSLVRGKRQKSLVSQFRTIKKSRSKPSRRS
jgi:hypothetical protein